MFAGRRAFEGGSNISTLAAIIHSDPTPIRELAPLVPADLERIIARCLKKVPDERFASMSDLAGELAQTGWQSPTPPQAAQNRPLFARFPPNYRQLALGLVLVLLVAAALILWRASTAKHTLEALSDSIVVLPFSNLGRDPDLDFLSDGLAESITNDLSRLSALRVIARTTAFSYKGHQPDLHKLGRDLGVRLVATGAVSRHRDQD